MSATISTALMNLLSADVVSDAQYEHFARLLLSAGAPDFGISNGRREIAWLQNRLDISESGVLEWPRCVACKEIARSASFRAEFGDRLCASCLRDRRARAARAVRECSRRA